MEAVTRYNLLNLSGVTVGLVAGIVLVVSKPQPPVEQAVAIEVFSEVLPQDHPGPIELDLPDPPILSHDEVHADLRPYFSLHLPTTVDPTDLTVTRGVLAVGTDGPSVGLDLDELQWGYNLLHLQGVDQFGWPIDRAFAVAVGGVEHDRWIENALAIHLSRDGFMDSDDIQNDLATIAEDRIAQALHEVGRLEAGPITARNLRAGIVDVRLEPRSGGVRARVALRSIHVDIESSVVDATNFPIHRIWVNADLTVTLNAEGRPVVSVDTMEPHVDLVESGEGAVAWLLDHGAWFVEIAAELLSADPLKEALSTAIDDALAQWETDFEFESRAPLAATDFTVDYRFGALELTEDGLLAFLDFAIECDAPIADRTATGRITDPEPALQRLREIMRRGERVVRIGMAAEATNGVLHALWQCGALDSVVAFEEAHQAMPIAVPARVGTHFRLPPLLQNEDQSMVIAVADTLVDLVYADLTHTLSATGMLPIELNPADGGRSLAVGFAAQSPSLSLFTDCVLVAGRPCTDNPLFDRLAWLGVPFLPPIGAHIPLPDVRLSEADTLQFEINAVIWDSSRGALTVDGGYRVSSQ